MSEKKLRLVKDESYEKSPTREVFEEGFKEGYARGSQQATEYYSQEIKNLHAQIFKLQQERSGLDQAPRSATLRGLIESELRKEGFLESEIDRRISLIRANSSQPIIVETVKSDINEPDLDEDDFFEI